ncbi:hypothetical protein ACFLUU_07235 [Chloroflexota bacterium]
METIGFNFNDLVNIQTTALNRVDGATEEQKQLSIANHISRGCSQDEAQYRATITGEMTAITISLLATIDANNKRILFDLKETGILS